MDGEGTKSGRITNLFVILVPGTMECKKIVETDKTIRERAPMSC